MLRLIHARARTPLGQQASHGQLLASGRSATSFGYGSGGLIPYVFAVVHLFGCSPGRGASRIVRLASAREYAGTTGHYFYKDKLARPNPLAEDNENAERLWQATARL